MIPAEVNIELRLDENIKLGPHAYPIIQETVDEAIKFREAESRANAEINGKTILYQIEDYDVCVLKPGKEKFESNKTNKNYKDKRQTNNPNDMTPTVYKSNERYEKNLTFGQIWEHFEKFKNLANQEYLEVLGAVLFRQAWMLDHHKTNNSWRWIAPKHSINFLSEHEIEIEGMSTEAFLYFLEVLALQESVKYYTLGFTNPESKKIWPEADAIISTDKKVGRVNNVLTGCHFIAVLMNKAPIWTFAGRLSSGVAPITQKNAPKYFSPLA